MKTITFLSLMVLLACSNPSGPDEGFAEQKLYVTVTNISGHDFKYILVAGQPLYSLAAGKSQVLAGFKTFGFDTGMVDEDISLVCNGKQLNNHSRNFWCGTEKVKAESGHFKITLDVVNNKLQIRCKNPIYYRPKN